MINNLNKTNQKELMIEPVIISSGHTFEKKAIVEWFDDGNTINPLTGEQLQNIDIKLHKYKSF